jgi:hypothetical protein
VKYFLVLLIFLIGSACSHQRSAEEIAQNPEEAPPKSTKSPVKPKMSIESKEIAALNQANDVIELDYRVGESRLSKAEESRLLDALNKTLEGGGRAEVDIISWSDHEYPADKSSQSKDDIRLAKNRNDYLKSLIKRWNEKVSIRQVNMAEKPSMFEKLVHHKKFEIKQELESTGIQKKKSKSIVLVSKGRNPK